jgi:hypothetical protein
MKTTKKRKSRKKVRKTSLLRTYWNKLKGWGEGLLNWLEWNTNTLWSLGLIAFGLGMLCPSIMPWTVIAWGALLVGGARLLLDLRDRWL